VPLPYGLRPYGVDRPPLSWLWVSDPIILWYYVCIQDYLCTLFFRKMPAWFLGLVLNSQIYVRIFIALKISICK
jgi:hypothetical protein